MEGLRGRVRNIKQFVKARLSVFRPGELGTPGHIQTKCNSCDWW